MIGNGEEVLVLASEDAQRDNRVVLLLRSEVQSEPDEHLDAAERHVEGIVLGREFPELDTPILPR